MPIALLRIICFLCIFLNYKVFVIYLSNVIVYSKRSLYCDEIYDMIFLGATVTIGGGFAFQMYEYIQASSHFGGDAYEESITRGWQVLLDIVNVITTIIRTVILLVRLVYDIVKDRKQKSNRQTKV